LRTAGISLVIERHGNGMRGGLKGALLKMLLPKTPLRALGCKSWRRCDISAQKAKSVA